MATEIELKAHVLNVEKTLLLIRETQGISNEIYQEKKDVYFARNNELPILRTRLITQGDGKSALTSTTVITVKEKNTTNGIEDNHEMEINTDSGKFETTIEMFQSLGYKIAIKKEKKGYSFILKRFEKDLHIELIEVNPLGWFIEMEFCIPDNVDDKSKGYLKNNLLEALKLFNIDKGQIENKYYIELLNKA